MNAPALTSDDGQRRALEYPLDGPLLAVTGPAGTGKSSVLLQRASRATTAVAAAGAVLLSAASPRGVALVRERAATAGLLEACRIRTLEEFALEILLERARANGTSPPEIIDDVRAAILFQGVGAELFSLEWPELLGTEIDPEITGLRHPEFFADAAFRLIRRLRGGLISPDEFRTQSLQGATRFYGKPPNFADAGLLMKAEKYRDSLRVSPAELEHQRGREIDLIKVLSRLYASYVDSLVARGCMTALDAVYEATRALRADAAAAARVRERTPCALIDDAQDLYGGQIGLLKAVYGEHLHGVTVAGDAAQATREFAGARGRAFLESATANVTLAVQYRCPAPVLRAAGIVMRVPRLEPAQSWSPAVELYRGASLDDETRYVAETVRTLLGRGVAPERIAVVTRNLRIAHPFAGALLARDVPLDVAGQASLYEFHATADALGALWAFYDPYRHDWLLRNLESPWLHLSDSTIAALCGEASDPQALLFELPPSEEIDETRRRWDRKRDVRLARNVTRGDVDAELPGEARERLGEFRAALLRWEELERRIPLPALARTILSETVLPSLGDDARGRFARGCTERLLTEIEEFVRHKPLATLGDYLEAAEESAAAEADLLHVDPVSDNCVMLLDVEAAKGREFDHVFIVGACAGSFPRYYVPDSFLFTPKYGMIPKENVGDEARAARTAKFTYASCALNLTEKYNEEERRAFGCAATRARERLYVSAYGRATKAKNTPEFYEELRAASADS